MTTIFNLKYQKNIRRILRKQEILPEKILWSKISNKQLIHRFRRQYGIGNYVVDFYCPKLRLVIEIDGATHANYREVKYDKVRQNYLLKLGLTVNRYTNTNIKENLSDVLADINNACEEIFNKSKEPHSHSPLRRGGENSRKLSSPCEGGD